MYCLREECSNPEYADKLVETFVNKIYYSKDRLVIWLNYTKKPPEDDKIDTAEVEKIIIEDIINKKREQGSPVLRFVFVLNV